MKKATLLALTALFFALSAQSQTDARVLFIGNSYTEVNNLPQMTENVARSMGCTLTWSSNTPGGCTFSQHCTNQSMTLIREGSWDFVVLQEQSQYPSFPQSQVEEEVFPYAERLVDSVYAHSPCAEPMFYMTWGRQNGDAYNAQFFPILGSYEGMDSMLYEGMDSMLYERYVYMAEAFDASVCPVGRVWRYLREHHPEIELYAPDGSHPSVAGSYAGACSFFVMFFGRNPEEIAFEPSGLEREVAGTIRHAVFEVVFRQLGQWKRPQPTATVSLLSSEGDEATLVAHATHADSLTWDFGDGTTTSISTATGDSIATHRYADTGNYEVTLIASRHCMTDTARVAVHIIADTTEVGVDAPQSSAFDAPLQIFPNPTKATPTVTLHGKPMAPSEITVIASDGRTIPFGEELPAGVFTLQVKKEGRVYKGTLIKL